MLPDSIRKFIEVFSGLPGIGTRQAARLSFFLVRNGRVKIEELSRSAEELLKLKTCAFCFFIHDNPGLLCKICGNPKRNKKIILILERETDLLSIEKTKLFEGRYFILGESAKAGIFGPEQKIRLNSLKSWIGKEIKKADEIILGFNPTTYGDVSSGTIAKELEGLAAKITRLGRGIPTGGEIEFADEETLGAALARRI